MQTLVATAELGRFQETYVSLHMLAKERKRHHIMMKMEFDAAGVRPAFEQRFTHVFIGAATADRKLMSMP
jgi:hypothetical protein